MANVKAVRLTGVSAPRWFTVRLGDNGGIGAVLPKNRIYPVCEYGIA